MGINVAIVEGDRIFREKLEGWVNDASGYRCVCASGSAEEALKVIPRLLPDVVLMDIHLPSMSGVDCTRRIRNLCPSVQILVLTAYEDNDRIFSALKAGVSGYLLKRTDSAGILHAIREVKQGGAPMSSRIARRVIESFHEKNRDPHKSEKLSRSEEEILQCLAKGYSNKEIATRSSVSVNTVRTHLHHIYEKLHVRSRTEAVLKHLH